MIEDGHLVHYEEDGSRIVELARDRNIVMCRVERPFIGKGDERFVRTEYATWFSRKLGDYSLGHYFTGGNERGAWKSFVERWEAEPDV